MLNRVIGFHIYTSMKYYKNISRVFIISNNAVLEISPLIVGS